MSDVWGVLRRIGVVEGVMAEAAAASGVPSSANPVLGMAGQDLGTLLLEARTLEPKYQPALALPHTTKNCSEITMGMRNGSAHVLRCLKVWYDLPSDTFFNAINIMDRFLTRMKAQPKHLSCIAVSAFHMSCEYSLKYPHLREAYQLPERQDLTTISQCKCSPKDVERMEAIMKDKLATDLQTSPPVTPLTLLRLLHAAHTQLAQSNTPAYSPMPITRLTHKLEILICDARAAVFRPAELALALLALELQTDMVNAPLHQACLQHLHSICGIADGSFEQCREVVSQLIHQYENQTQTPHRQRLVWKLSNRTLRQLRPTDKLTTRLPTIDETQPPYPIRARNDSECSSLSEILYNSSSEEEMDYDYDEDFPPLPAPAGAQRSALKSTWSPSKKAHTNTFPYPQYPRKYSRVC